MIKISQGNSERKIIQNLSLVLQLAAETRDLESLEKSPIPADTKKFLTHIFMCQTDCIEKLSKISNIPIKLKPLGGGNDEPHLSSEDRELKDYLV